MTDTEPAATPATGSGPDLRRDKRHRASPTRSELFSTEASEQHGLNVRVLSGSPTAEEIAAVTAVLTAAVVEEASNADTIPTDGPSAWQRSQRTMRSTLTPGAGRWRNFSV